MKAKIGKWYLFYHEGYKVKMLGDVVEIQTDFYHTKYLFNVRKYYRYNSETKEEEVYGDKQFPIGTTKLVKSHHIFKEMTDSDLIWEMLDD